MLHFGRAAAALVLGAALATGSAVVADPAIAYDGWRMTDSTAIESKGAGWDYLTLDAATGRLYIGHHEEGLQVFDLIPCGPEIAARTVCHDRRPG